MRFLVVVTLLMGLSWNCAQGIHLLRNSIVRLQRFAAVTLASSLIGLELPSPSFATVDFQTFHDKSYHASFKYPGNWIESVGQLSGRRSLTAFVDPDHPDTSVSIVYSPIAADFTKLTSLGGKDALRLYLVPQGEGVTAEVLDERTYGDTYYVEYVLSTPSIQKRHIQSVLALRPSEAIVGLNVQAPEDVFQAEKDTINVISPSLLLDKE